MILKGKHKFVLCVKKQDYGKISYVNQHLKLNILAKYPLPLSNDKYTLIEAESLDPYDDFEELIGNIAEEGITEFAIREEGVRGVFMTESFAEEIIPMYTICTEKSFVGKTPIVRKTTDSTLLSLSFLTGEERKEMLIADNDSVSLEDVTVEIALDGAVELVSKAAFFSEFEEAILIIGGVKQSIDAKKTFEKLGDKMMFLVFDPFSLIFEEYSRTPWDAEEEEEYFNRYRDTFRKEGV